MLPQLTALLVSALFALLSSPCLEITDSYSPCPHVSVYKAQSATERSLKRRVTKVGQADIEKLLAPSPGVCFAHRVSAGLDPFLFQRPPPSRSL
jgi:hypothetical protein